MSEYLASGDKTLVFRAVLGSWYSRMFTLTKRMIIHDNDNTIYEGITSPFWLKKSTYLRAKSEVITTANQSKSKYKKEPMRT